MSTKKINSLHQFSASVFIKDEKFYTIWACSVLLKQGIVVSVTQWSKSSSHRQQELVLTKLGTLLTKIYMIKGDIDATAQWLIRLQVLW